MMDITKIGEMIDSSGAYYTVKEVNEAQHFVLDLQADLEQCKVAMALYKPCNVAFEKENKQLQKALSRAIELLEDVYSGGFFDHLKAEIEKLKALKIRC